MTDAWMNVNGAMPTPTGIQRHWVSWEADPGALVIQILTGTGAIVRHLFPRGTVESVTNTTMRDVHRVCVNPTFLVDSVVFEFASAEDAMMFHWRIVEALGKVDRGGGSGGWVAGDSNKDS